MCIFNLYCAGVILQSFGDDCTLEEEGLVAEEDEIDQFNDDTFGAGAIGKFFSAILTAGLMNLPNKAYYITFVNGLAAIGGDTRVKPQHQLYHLPTTAPSLTVILIFF